MPENRDLDTGEINQLVTCLGLALATIDRDGEMDGLTRADIYALRAKLSYGPGAAAMLERSLENMQSRQAALTGPGSTADARAYATQIRRNIDDLTAALALVDDRTVDEAAADHDDAIFGPQ